LTLGSSRGAGVAAGLVIPMLHSTVASLCHGPQLAEPEALLRLALLVMREHLEARLRERYYVSLLVARYDRATGRVAFAGDYEGITVCPWHGSAGRPAQRVVGATPEGEPVVGGELYLAPHDLLLLHTQGLTRSSDFEDAPIDGSRVGAELERRRAEGVDEIRDGMLGLVDRWAGRRADLSVIVGRRLGPG
jgi:hypothetical protein